MTRNLLAKFKKPLEQSSRVVYESRISQDDQDWLIASGQLTDTKKESDRTTLYRTIASNHETNKFIHKIPTLIKENETLRQRVDELELEIKAMKHSQQPQRALSARMLQAPLKQTQLQKSIFKIIRQCRPLQKNKHWRCFTERDEQTAFPNYGDSYSFKMESTLRQERKRIGELVKENQKLMLQNQTLRKQCQQMVEQKSQFMLEMQNLTARFKQNLLSEQDLLAKQRNFYEQKVLSLQQQLTSAQTQKEVLKIQNDSLTSKLAIIQSDLATLKKQPSCFWNTLANRGSSPQIYVYASQQREGLRERKGETAFKKVFSSTITKEKSLF